MGGPTAAVIPTALTPILMFSLEPWLVDRETRMITTTTRGDFVMNEVALDYNSGFQMAVAGLLNDVAGATTAPPTVPPTDAPTAGPTDGPTDPATTRDPNNNCPGGNLETCISLCPEEDADIP